MKSPLPKPLVPVGGRPMVRYLIDALEGAGVKDIAVVIGHGVDEMRQELVKVTSSRFKRYVQKLQMRLHAQPML